ncbi:MAG: hypothetical protein IJU52_03320 [Clostridia bacterium]|nr:hypothetical protein [Clostridia bacterium]
MKKGVVLSAVLLMIGMFLFCACDPVYPPGELKAEAGPLTQGASDGIHITYPNIGGTVVCGWKNQNAEIIDGSDIVSIDGLTVTGLKPGTARIKVSAATVLSEVSAAEGYTEKVYSAEINVKVEERSRSGQDKLNVAYVYVEYLDKDGFGGSGTFGDGVYVAYPGADGAFKVFDTVRIEFYGSQFRTEDKTVTLPSDPDHGGAGTKTFRQIIDKAESARLAKHENGEPVYS